MVYTLSTPKPAKSALPSPLTYYPYITGQLPTMCQIERAHPLHTRAKLLLVESARCAPILPKTPCTSSNFTFATVTRRVKEQRF